MPTSLPYGYVDTGIARTTNISGSVQFYWGFPTYATFDHGWIGVWTVEWRQVGPQGEPLREVVELRLSLQGEAGVLPSPGYVVLETLEGSTTGTEGEYPPPLPTWSKVYTFTESDGPSRLGVIYSEPSEVTPPTFAQQCALQYQWFAPDAVQNSTFGGVTMPESAPGRAALLAEIGFEIYGQTSGAGTDAPGEGQGGTVVHFTDLALDGALIDTTGLNDFENGGGGVVQGLGPGAIDIILPPTPDIGEDIVGAIWAGRPWEFTYLLHVTKDGAGSAGATIRPSWLPPDGPPTTTEGREAFTVQRNSWTAPTFEGTAAFAIDSAWAVSQDPPLRTDDLTIPIMGCPALMDPSCEQYSTSGTVVPSAPITFTGTLTGFDSVTVAATVSGTVSVALDSSGNQSGTVSVTLTGAISDSVTRAVIGSLTASFSGPLDGPLTGSSSITLDRYILSEDLATFSAGFSTQTRAVGSSGTIQFDVLAAFSGAFAGPSASLTFSLSGDSSADVIFSAANGSLGSSIAATGSGVTLSGSFSATESGAFNRVQRWYNPLTLTIPTVVELNRPDGNEPSLWVSSDTGSLTVDDSGASTLISVSSPGASVIKTLTTNWANYIDYAYSDTGLTNQDNASLGDLEGYEIVRHNLKDSITNVQQHIYPEDIYWWANYGWLRAEITAPSAGSLSLLVDYVHLSVPDPHITSTERLDDLQGITQIPRSVTYDIPLQEGSNTVYLDLLFPPAGGPVYLGRVTTLTLSNFAEGSYGLSSLALVAGVDGGSAQAPPLDGYFKHAFGIPRTRETTFRPPDFNAVAAAMDGSFWFGNIPDQVNKPDEIGSYGGGPRFVDVLTGVDSNTILDSQYPLQTYSQRLHRSCDGAAFAYSSAAYDAANVDSYGVALGPELAQWICDRSQLPYRQPALNGSSYTLQPQCRPVCGSVTIVPAINFLIHAETAIGAGIEVLPSIGGGRAPAGVTVRAFDTSTNTWAASGSTDTDGYCVLTPVPANETDLYVTEAD